jgi:hypothetical protein
MPATNYANIELQDTFDTWRIRTNELIGEINGSLLRVDDTTEGTVTHDGLFNITTANVASADISTLYATNATVSTNLTVNGTANIASMTVGDLTVTDIIIYDGNFGGDNVVTANLQVTSNADLGAVTNLTITGGLTGQVLTTDGAGNLTWSAKTEDTTELSQDLSPELGANLELHNYSIVSDTDYVNIGEAGDTVVVGKDAKANIANYKITAAGADMTVGGNGIATTESSPTIFFIKGQTYALYNDTGDSTVIELADGAGNAYTTGVVAIGQDFSTAAATAGQAAAGEVILFTVPLDAPTALKYRVTGGGAEADIVVLDGQSFASIVAQTAKVQDAIVHDGDEDTKIAFTDNQIEVYAGNTKLVTFDQNQAKFDGNGHVVLPVGDDDNRITGEQGALRFNSERLALETYNGADWLTIQASGGTDRSTVFAFFASGF